MNKMIINPRFNIKVPLRGIGNGSDGPIKKVIPHSRTDEIRCEQKVYGEYLTLLKKYPVNDFIKNESEKVGGSYNFQHKRIEYSFNSNTPIPVLYRILRHEMAHHVTLQAFDVTEWMELSKLNHFKILVNGELFDLIAPSKADLINLSEMCRWFIVNENQLLTFCASEYMTSEKLAADEINAALNYFKRVSGFKENEIEMHHTENNRFRNILEMVADDLSFYISDKPNFNKTVRDLAEKGQINVQATVEEIKLFRKYFS